MVELREIDSIEELEGLLADSKERPVLLFKHSLTCPISTRAFREFESFLESAPPSISCNLITVQTARPVSNEAAVRLSVTHETPQAILIRNGHEIWSASHFAITAESLQEALRSVT
jgi:bacillithiol system protein YtxJ